MSIDHLDPNPRAIADIALRMHLSTSTVRNYLSSAIGRTWTRNKTGAALQARRMGWLQLIGRLHR